MTIGEIDGETLLILLAQHEGTWQPAFPVRISITDGVIDRITD